MTGQDELESQGLYHDPFCPLISSPAPLFASPAPADGTPAPADGTPVKEQEYRSLISLSETRRSSSFSSLGTLSADRSLVVGQLVSPVFEDYRKSPVDQLQTGTGPRLAVTSSTQMKKSDALTARAVSWSPLQESAPRECGSPLQENADAGQPSARQILSPDPCPKPQRCEEAAHNGQSEAQFKIVPVLWKQGETPRGAGASDSIPTALHTGFSMSSSRTDESVTTTGQLTARSTGRSGRKNSMSIAEEVQISHDITQSPETGEQKLTSEFQARHGLPSRRSSPSGRAERIRERRLKEAIASGIDKLQPVEQQAAMP
jgi:hypothetical protein